MKCRPFKQEDLVTVADWFADVEWPMPMAENIMPKIGVICETKEGTLAACGWLYTTMTSLALLSWTGTNPELESSERAQAFDMMIKDIQKAIDENKPTIKCLMVLTKSEALEAQLKRHRFRAKKGYSINTWLSV